MRNEKSPTYILGFWTLISSNRWYFSIKKKIFCPFESIFFFFFVHRVERDKLRERDRQARASQMESEAHQHHHSEPLFGVPVKVSWTIFHFVKFYKSGRYLKLKWKKYKARNVFVKLYFQFVVMTYTFLALLMYLLFFAHYVGTR